MSESKTVRVAEQDKDRGEGKRVIGGITLLARSEISGRTDFRGPSAAFW